jgi:hypothetical protein
MSSATAVVDKLTANRTAKVAWSLGIGIVLIVLGFYIDKALTPSHDGFQAYILPQYGATVRVQPLDAATAVSVLPYNSAVTIVCTQMGSAVTGPGPGTTTITSHLWDKVRANGSDEPIGFVPDALVKTGTTKPEAGPC